MGRLLFTLLLIPAAAAAQLGVPMSSLPGVQSAIPAAAASGAGGGAASGIVIPQERLNRLLGATIGGGSAASVGDQIERSFYGTGKSGRVAAEAGIGLAGPAVRSIAGSAPTGAGESGVAANGVGVTLPASQSLLPSSARVPGSVTRGSGTGAESTTGVSNLYSGTGRPRSGDNP